MHRIGVIVGSLRKDSINLKLARVLAKLGKDKFDFNIIKLDDVPMYNEDLWENPPESVLRLKKEVEFSDAILFVTPEYNRSFSPVVKNAIDWGTRPYGQNSWAGKPASVIGASPGAVGTSHAQSQLRSIVPILDMALMGQPEVYLSFKPEFYDENDDVTDQSTKDFLEKYLVKFDAWINQTSRSK